MKNILVDNREKLDDVSWRIVERQAQMIADLEDQIGKLENQDHCCKYCGRVTRSSSYADEC